MQELIEARDVTKVYGEGLLAKDARPALADVSFVTGGGAPLITAIVGETGSGKTTLARLLLGLISPTTGQVLYRGTDLRRLNSSQRRAFLGDVQVIFQDPYEVYNPFYTVDHVLNTPIKRFGLARSKQEARQLVERVLGTVGLRPEETLGRHPHELSGGQRQRVMIARALLLRPQLIVADEPVSMLDASLRATILQTLRVLNREFGISLIYITHDLTTAYQISHQMIVLYQGRVVEVGDTERIVKSPQHPYTRLLVRSVPLPNPERRWDAVPAATGDGNAPASDGCPFAGRCASATAECRLSVPPLFRIETRRAAACFLHREAPAIEPRQMTEVLEAAGRTSAAI